MVGGLLAAPLSPAQAQLFERRQGPPSGGFNPFGFLSPLFERQPPREYREYREPREHRENREYREYREPRVRREPRSAPVADQTKPPPPQKSDTTPTKRIVVMGSSLSDWLAYGLEEIYADQPEIGVIRKNHVLAGLVRFDAKDDTTWPKVAREFLKDQHPDIIVVMFGLEDRMAIRERAAARDTQQQGQQQPVQQQPVQQQQGQRQPEPEQQSDPEQPAAAVAPEQRRGAGQSFEFRTEQWAAAYARRIDEMIAAVRSKGVPVIWVGLPAIRGTRSTSDMIYLNDLFRARAEKAGIVYVDVWDGFVDEAGRYTNYGPDVEGQARRLRTTDGVYLTKAGARKLAHYVEREIKALMGTRPQPVALPTQDEPGQPPAVARPGEPAPQPAAGPVVPLTGAGGAGDLMGGAARSGGTDSLAARVLVRGNPLAPLSGRADNFFLTPEAAEAAKAAGAAAPEPAAPPATATATAPVATDELLGGEEGKPAERKPVASVDPAPGAPRSGTPSRPARSADGRAQQPKTVQKKPRPTTPRDDRTVERWRQRQPAFDLFGLFR